MAPWRDAADEGAAVANGAVDAAALAGAVNSAEASRDCQSLCWSAATRCYGFANEL